MYLLFVGYLSIRYSYLWVETLTLLRPVGITTATANDLCESTLILQVLSTGIQL